MHVRIEPVASYEDRETIRAVICDAIRAVWPTFAPAYGAPDPSRLVVVKPNWIQESHELFPDIWEPLITHPTVVLATVESLIEAMGGCGTIAVCDAPNGYADFQAVQERGELGSQLKEVAHTAPDVKIEVIDLRRTKFVVRNGVVIERRLNRPDPRGYVRVNLGELSMLYGRQGEGRYYGADYDRNEVNRHHQGAVHEYLLSGTAMAADLFVNLPKLKTHKKTGITCCLKNLVGINGDKNWLPHYTEGSPSRGGDECPDGSPSRVIESIARRAGHALALRLPVVGPWALSKMRAFGLAAFGGNDEVIRNGNWHGNDTCWRMALDLNRALLYGSNNGEPPWRSQPRNYLAIVDGIVGGEGSGPLEPDAVNSRVLITGTNPAEIDAVACTIMGFEPDRIPLVREAFADHTLLLCKNSLEQVWVEDLRLGKTIPLNQVRPAVPRGFKPHLGWTNLLRSS